MLLAPSLIVRPVGGKLKQRCQANLHDFLCMTKQVENTYIIHEGAGCLKVPVCMTIHALHFALEIRRIMVSFAPTKEAMPALGVQHSTFVLVPVPGLCSVAFDS